MNIEDFKSQVESRNGVFRPNRFKCIIPRPNVMTNTQPKVAQDISFWCQSVNLPGYQFMTHDIKRWTYGPIEKRPSSPNFQQLQVQVMADGNLEVWKFFHDWMQYIMPHDRSKDNGLDGTSAYNGSHYELEYKYKENQPNYVVDFKVEVYRETGSKTKIVTCKEAFPSQVMAIPLGWQDFNTYGQFAVFFEYIDWYEDVIEQDSILIAKQATLTDIDQGE